jgi:hypothetical protein
VGRLGKVCLLKHGFRKTRMSLSRWSKHGQTTPLVTGHDPPIDITMYLDISINPGPQLSNTIESIITNRTESTPRNRFRPYSNLVQIPLAAPAIVYNNTARLIKCCVITLNHLETKVLNLLTIFVIRKSILPLLLKLG